jgi:hypothetical protein
VAVSARATGLEHDQVAAVVWAGPKPLYQFVRDPEIGIFVQRAAVWPAVVLLWALPVAALVLGARRRRRELSWATLGDPRLELEQPRARVGRAAVIGAAGAVGVVLAALALRIGLRHGLSEATRGRDEFILGFYVWTVSLGLAAQAIVAAITAATCRTAGIVLGLFSAALTAVGAAISLFALPSLASCVDFVAIRSGATGCAWSVQGSFIRQTFEQMLAHGTLAALLGGTIGAVGAAIVARQRAPAATPVPI